MRDMSELNEKKWLAALLRFDPARSARGRCSKRRGRHPLSAARSPP